MPMKSGFRQLPKENMRVFLPTLEMFYLGVALLGTLPPSAAPRLCVAPSRFYRACSSAAVKRGSLHCVVILVIEVYVETKGTHEGRFL